MEFFNLKQLKALQKNGVNFENLNLVYISSDSIIEPGVFVGANVKITGKSLIKQGAKITCFTEIENSIIGENTVVKHSYIENSKIGNNCQIGPFSHIKQRAMLHDDIRVGNYVEIKNSTLKSGTKCAHLAYIGDAELGENVNVGCGVVFANYDGKNKHKTRVGNNVFIGCNCNLIAPLIVEDGVFIAAGTTVTKNLEQNAFCIGRSREIIKQKRDS